MAAWLLAALPTMGQTNGSFVIGDADFLLNGRPYQMRGGELHYTRIPREYWAHRLQMARAMGLNTITVSLFWNVHEPRPGKFDFSGNADIAAFCRQAQREGLKVILGSGPYSCAEWDFGGLPWWLLKDPNLRVRTRDPRFMEAAGRYLKAVGEQLAPLQVTRGGPIILVRVEGEYGAYGQDKQYIGQLRELLKATGFDGVSFFTVDMPSRLKSATLDDLFCAIDFQGPPAEAFRKLREVRPTGPLMCGEWYPGWFDTWGLPSLREGRSAKNTEGIAWMLEHNVSFSLYMAHGGTSFGFSSGANGPPFHPLVTSYDYGAPISEAGWEMPKYRAYRDLLLKHLASGEVIPNPPARLPVIQIPALELPERAALFENLPEAKKERRPRNMEAYDQAHGCVLYRTTLPVGGGEQLAIRELHDYGVVFVGGHRIGTIDRRLKPKPVVLPTRTNVVGLDILVEAAGHINYGAAMQFDLKGITEKVQLLGGPLPRELIGWEVFNLPLDDEYLANLRYSKGGGDGPAFYRGRFELGQVGDTFLDLRGWGKGMVWVNGHNLGRYWRIGPQQTLYCPGPWLKRGRNEVVVFELNAPVKPVIAGLAEPVLGELETSPAAGSGAK